ncbi:DNA-binding transcriptional regulator, MarR family [Tistlia consotensis]|uniref:Transcriptional regulator, MarR family n=1 Tax=Tistlia consotensis USBA 355 TaxID=560819 RepID=A0A1Y6CSL4_9PROT|nr:MarR family transcriptional regulator [Tistlia consotensis]SMF70624.1 transcriptional regulator, MarR family [Tistlia consotensis USBA 355]SNS04290.1 DNA-binding transcriptional regulator, MarR family [Tistlia consotensis]
MNDVRTEKDAALADLLCFSIYSAEHAFTQLYRPLLEGMGLTYPQYLVMTLLWARDDRTVRDLGQALHLQSNTLTPLLKRLEALELVTRRRDETDERVVRIRLTGRGRSLRKGAAAIPDCVAEATGLSPDALRDAIALLDRLRDSLAACGKAEQEK